jgi:hypothetical protein
MYGEATLTQQLFVNNSSAQLDGTAEARRMAAHLFRQVRLDGWIGRLLSRLVNRDSRLASLKAVEQSAPVKGRRYVGLRTVPVEKIRGSEGRISDFDGHFRPLHAHNRSRWIAIAAARFAGLSLPAVELIEVGDAYFVRDGHHRISVARALGESAVEADVTFYSVTSQESVPAASAGKAGAM